MRHIQEQDLGDQNTQLKSKVLLFLFNFLHQYASILIITFTIFFLLFNCHKFEMTNRTNDLLILKWNRNVFNLLISILNLISYFLFPFFLGRENINFVIFIVQQLWRWMTELLISRKEEMLITAMLNSILLQFLMYSYGFALVS